ncbi:MAG: hypothetical protein RMJ19_01230, partial [Gemmatales bacterium]|nr:hypothetical protein [Gemmatales bacterium]MDW8174269.1 hypothetical protein [Gemmatales bacterium]
MTHRPTRTGNPLRDPPWTFGELWLSALLWSSLAPLLVVLLAGLDWSLGWTNDLAWDVRLIRWGLLTVFLAAGIFLGYLLYWSRTVRASMFVVVTLGVTSLSLLVLIWFICSLLIDGWRWLRATQVALRNNNEALLRRVL